jgi:oxalate decarboxylase
MSQNKSEKLPEFKFSLAKQKAREFPAGWAKEATVKNFPVSENIAGVLMSLKPGGLRELHWHSNAAEWGYVISGKVRTTIIDPQGHYEINDFSAGDIWYFPRGHGHCIEGLSPDGTTFMLVLTMVHFQNLQLSAFQTGLPLHHVKLFLKIYRSARMILRVCLIKRSILHLQKKRL